MKLNWRSFTLRTRKHPQFNDKKIYWNCNAIKFVGMFESAKCRYWELKCNLCWWQKAHINEIYFSGSISPFIRFSPYAYCLNSMHKFSWIWLNGKTANGTPFCSMLDCLHNWTQYKCFDGSEGWSYAFLCAAIEMRVCWVCWANPEWKTSLCVLNFNLFVIGIA